MKGPGTHPGSRGLDLQQLFEGQRLSTEAKVDLFEEMATLAFQADARDQFEILFFALHPPDAKTERFAEVAEVARQRHGFRKNAVARNRMHVTLLPSGRATRLLAPYEVSLERAAASLDFEAFDVTFDHVRGFPTGRDHCFVAGCDAESTRRLRELHGALVHALRMQGIAPLRSGPLQPHLTLFYGTHSCPPPEPIEPVAWQVDRFVLIRSLSGQGKHIIEGEWCARD